MTIDIPKGQRVRIRKYDGNTPRKYKGSKIRAINKQDPIENLNDTTFILMEPVTFNVSSNFTELIQTESGITQYLGGEILKAFGLDTAAALATGVTEYAGFQKWQSTGLLDTELSIGLISQGDAKKDVIEPMLNLMKITIPEVVQSENTVVNTARLLKLPGPSIIRVIQNVFDKSASNKEYTSSDTEFTICVGNLVFDHVIITGVTPTIMPDVDENGYPLSVFLKVKFKCTRIPNNLMLDEIFAGWED